MHTVAAIVLAAGASSRLGHPKQLVTLAGEPLLDRAIRVAAEAGCAPVLAVLGANAAAILAACALPGATVLLHADWAEGMASSIVCGVAALASGAHGDPVGTLLLACDQPAVTPAHLQALAAAGTLTASRYAGRHGIPAFFPASCFEDLLELTGDTGARNLLQSAPAIDLPHGELDLDIPADLDRLAATQESVSKPFILKP